MHPGTKGKKPCDDAGRDWREVSTTQECQAFPAISRAWERGTEQMLAQPLEGTNPGDTLITDFRHPEL